MSDLIYGAIAITGIYMMAIGILNASGIHTIAFRTTDMRDGLITLMYGIVGALLFLLHDTRKRLGKYEDSRKVAEE